MIYVYGKGILERWFENENGCTESTEVLYTHFFRRSLLVKTRVEDKFIIVPNKILRYKDVISASILKRYNSKFVYLTLRIDNIKQKILRKFRLK